MSFVACQSEMWWYVTFGNFAACWEKQSACKMNAGVVHTVCHFLNCCSFYDSCLTTTAANAWEQSESEGRIFMFFLKQLKCSLCCGESDQYSIVQARLHNCKPSEKPGNGTGEAIIVRVWMCVGVVVVFFFPSGLGGQSVPCHWPLPQTDMFSRDSSSHGTLWHPPTHTIPHFHPTFSPTHQTAVGAQWSETALKISFS